MTHLTWIEAVDRLSADEQVALSLSRADGEGKACMLSAVLNSEWWRGPLSMRQGRGRLFFGRAELKLGGVCHVRPSRCTWPGTSRMGKGTRGQRLCPFRRRTLTFRQEGARRSTSSCSRRSGIATSRRRSRPSCPPRTSGRSGRGSGAERQASGLMSGGLSGASCHEICSENRALCRTAKNEEAWCLEPCGVAALSARR